MAKMTKAAARRRMVECQKKVLAVMETNYLTSASLDTLWKIRKQLMHIETKLK